MNFSGLIIGLIAFFCIGIFHPIVIKCQYYFTDKIWPVFLIGGIMFCIFSLFVDQYILSASFAVIGFSSLWSIGELKEQTRRVERGWFPKNPKH
jgi:hypothetical protein